VQAGPIASVEHGVDWPAWVQAVGSVVAIIVSVWLAVWLQNRDRAQRRADELDQQVAALTEIAGRCVTTLGRIGSRLHEAQKRQDILNYLTDEANAMEFAVSSIDLMALKSKELTLLAADLQFAVRTGRRHLGYQAVRIHDGEPLLKDQFSGPVMQARKVLGRLQELGGRTDTPAATD
jgi:hypothetical protein